MAPAAGTYSAITDRYYTASDVYKRQVQAIVPDLGRHTPKPRGMQVREIHRLGEALENL